MHVCLYEYRVVILIFLFKILDHYYIIVINHHKNRNNNKEARKWSKKFVFCFFVENNEPRRLLRLKLNYSTETINPTETINSTEQ